MIAKICKQIEQENGVKILFCVEGGSRVWRMASKNSDYDARLVFYRPLKEYISTNKRGETIAQSYDEQRNKVSPEGALYDFQGFDIFKFTRMLHSSNPTVIEWLLSDIVYYGKKPKVFVDFAKDCFKPISLYYHYKSMCKQNYLKYLKSGNQVTYKKYLYAMRGLVNAKWVTSFKTLPPINFIETLHCKQLPVPETIRKRLLEIIKLKQQGKEKDIVQNEVRIDEYIESNLKDDSDAPKYKQSAVTTELDKEIRKILGVK